MKIIYFVICVCIVLVYIYNDIKNIHSKNLLVEGMTYNKSTKEWSTVLTKGSREWIVFDNIINDKNYNWEVTPPVYIASDGILDSKKALISLGYDDHIIVNYQTKYGFPIQVVSENKFKKLRDKLKLRKRIDDNGNWIHYDEKGEILKTKHH